jgi:hypothetical protein
MNRTLKPGKNNSYTVADDFDHTGVVMQPLDHYILDDVVVSVVQGIFELPQDVCHQWSTWAVNNPEDAVCFFSRPYCKAAVRVFGYLNTFGNDADKRNDME